MKNKQLTANIERVTVREKGREQERERERSNERGARERLNDKGQQT